MNSIKDSLSVLNAAKKARDEACASAWKAYEKRKEELK